MRTSIVAILLLLLSAQALSADADKPSAEEVLAFIHSDGKRAAVKKYFSEDGTGFNGYEMVAAGSKQWVSIGIELLYSTDAAEREALFSAVAQALPIAPSQVLPLVKARNARVLCLPLSVGDDDLKSWQPYLLKLERSLERVADPALQEGKNLCLKEIHIMRDELLQNQLKEPVSFTPATAMTAIFATYSEEHVGTLIPVRFTPMWEIGKADTLATPIVVTTYKEGTEERGVLVVQRQKIFEAEPETSHATAPDISVYIFRHTSNRWIYNSGKKVVTSIGSHGEAPNAEVIRVGQRKFGLLFIGGDVHQGYTNDYAELISLSEQIPSVILSVPLGESNSGTCSDDAPVAGEDSLPPCWEETGKLQFTENPGSDYFTIKVHYSGTRPNEEDGAGKDGIIKVDRLDVFSFVDGVYKASPSSAHERESSVKTDRDPSIQPDQLGNRMNGAFPRSLLNEDK